MSDDEADPELLELLRQSLFVKKPDPNEISSDTGVLRHAEFIYSNAIDVSVDMAGTKSAALSIYSMMQERGYSTEAWSSHELHPKASEGFSDVDIVNFIFTMDLLNFSFWSDLPEASRYQVDYRGKRWTGYNSLVASLRRALDGGVPITSPRFWNSAEATDENLGLVFFGATDEQIPLLKERIEILREAGSVLHETFGDPNEDILHDESVNNIALQPSTSVEQANDSAVTKAQDASHEEQVSSNKEPTTNEALAPVAVSLPEVNSELTQPADAGMPTESVSDMSAQQIDTLPAEAHAHPKPDLSVIRLIEKADHSAGKLVNLLAKHFSCFRDETRFENRKVRLMKRAQIFVADLWAAFNGAGYGEFHDIDHLTMFADYRVPQMLHSLGVLSYSPPLSYYISDKKVLASGHSWEVQLRGCSIWAVELIRREITQSHPEAAQQVNAVLIDFFLYDLAKEREKGADGGLLMGHHRTRSIWY